MRVDIELVCANCGYGTILKWKDPDLLDNEGKKVIFRRSCPECGYVEKIKQEGN